MTGAPKGSPLRLGIAGLGTVGGGVIRMVEENADLLIEKFDKLLTELNL